MFDDRVPKRIFGQKKEKVAEDGRKLHSEKFMICILRKFFRVLALWRLSLVENVARKGERIGVYKALVGKTRRKERLGSPRHSGEDNIKMDLY